MSATPMEFDREEKVLNIGRVLTKLIVKFFKQISTIILNIGYIQHVIL